MPSPLIVRGARAGTRFRPDYTVSIGNVLIAEDDLIPGPIELGIRLNVNGNYERRVGNPSPAWEVVPGDNTWIEPTSAVGSAGLWARSVDIDTTGAASRVGPSGWVTLDQTRSWVITKAISGGTANWEFTLQISTTNDVSGVIDSAVIDLQVALL